MGWIQSLENIQKIITFILLEEHEELIDGHQKLQKRGASWFSWSSGTHWGSKLAIMLSSACKKQISFERSKMLAIGMSRLNDIPVKLRAYFTSTLHGGGSFAIIPLLKGQPKLLRLPEIANSLNDSTNFSLGHGLLNNNLLLGLGSIQCIGECLDISLSFL